jgi:hypothetical protein
MIRRNANDGAVPSTICTGVPNPAIRPVPTLDHGAQDAADDRG